MEQGRAVSILALCQQEQLDFLGDGNIKYLVLISLLEM